MKTRNTRARWKSPPRRRRLLLLQYNFIPSIWFILRNGRGRLRLSQRRARARDGFGGSRGRTKQRLLARQTGDVVLECRVTRVGGGSAPGPTWMSRFFASSVHASCSTVSVNRNTPPAPPRDLFLRRDSTTACRCHLEIRKKARRTDKLA